MTLSRRMRFDFCLKLQKPAKKPLLTKKMKAKQSNLLNHINIEPLNIGVRCCLAMNQPFSCLPPGSKTFVDHQEKDTTKNTRFQP